MALTLSACADVDLRQKRIDNPRRGDSVSASVGTMRLLAVRVVAPGDAVHVKGDTVGLFLTLANDGLRSDVLTSVTADAATSVVLRVGATHRKEGINSRSRPVASRPCSTPAVRTSSWWSSSRTSAEARSCR